MRRYSLDLGSAAVAVPAEFCLATTDVTTMDSGDGKYTDKESQVHAAAPTSLWKKVFAGVAAVAVIAVVGFAASGELDTAGAASDPPAAKAQEQPLFKLSSSSFGEFATLFKYPDLAEEAAFPKGTVTLTPGNRLSYEITGLELSTSGGIHIHANMACDSPGGHYWDGSAPANFTDPWKSTMWTSDAAGVAKGGWDVDELVGAYGFDLNAGHAVVVHDQSGVKVACGVLVPYSTEGMEVKATMAEYPGMDLASPPQGTISVSSDNVFSWDLYNLEPDSTGGVHGHVGFFCETAGPHLFKEGLPDFWTDVRWESDTSGVSKGSVDMSQFEGALPFADQIQRAAVVHWNNGSRASCGEVAVVAKDLSFGEFATLSKYPDLAEEAAFPEGTVTLTPGNRLSFVMTGLEFSTSGGIHIHANMACDSPGGHYWDESLADPWKSTMWTSDAAGVAQGGWDVDELVGAYGFDLNAGHAVVVHDQSGAKVACGVLMPYSTEGMEVKATMEEYPGMDLASPPQGTISVSSENVFSWDLYNLEPDSTGGVHGHVGFFCETAGPHLFKEGLSDFWNDVRWESNASGVSQGSVDMLQIEGALPFADQIQRAAVVHWNNGSRASCGELVVVATATSTDTPTATSTDTPTASSTDTPTATPTESGLSTGATVGIVAVFIVAAAALLALKRRAGRRAADMRAADMRDKKGQASFEPFPGHQEEEQTLEQT